jgi:hypothetical protein
MNEGQMAILEAIYKGEDLQKAIDFWKRVPQPIKDRVPAHKIADYILKNEYLWLDKNQTKGGNQSDA